MILAQTAIGISSCLPQLPLRQWLAFTSPAFRFTGDKTIRVWGCLCENVLASSAFFICVYFLLSGVCSILNWALIEQVSNFQKTSSQRYHISPEVFQISKFINNVVHDITILTRRDV